MNFITSAQRFVRNNLDTLTENIYNHPLVKSVNEVATKTWEYIPQNFRFPLKNTFKLSILFALGLKAWDPDKNISTISSNVAMFAMVIFTFCWKRMERLEELDTVIAQSQRERETKDGVALVISASKDADRTGAFAWRLHSIEDMRQLAKHYTIVSKQASSANELCRLIEEECSREKTPIKVVVIRAHGATNSMRIGKEITISPLNQQFITALEKTDTASHILLMSCSTGKLGCDDPFALQLSRRLPGRTVSGLSRDDQGCLMEAEGLPQKIALLGEFGPGHSFRSENNKTDLKILRFQRPLSDDPRAKMDKESALKQAAQAHGISSCSYLNLHIPIFSLSNPPEIEKIDVKTIYATA